VDLRKVRALWVVVTPVPESVVNSAIEGVDLRKRSFTQKDLAGNLVREALGKRSFWYQDHALYRISIALVTLQQKQFGRHDRILVASGRGHSAERGGVQLREPFTGSRASWHVCSEARAILGRIGANPRGEPQGGTASGSAAERRAESSGAGKHEAEYRTLWSRAQKQDCVERTAAVSSNLESCRNFESSY